MRSVYQREDVLPLVAGVFRELGYDGTSISRITEKTGLGKGSLYHFFPGGKEEMAAAVLAEVDSWFTLNIFTPLHEQAAASAISAMWQAVESYFHSGQRICLLGAFALDETRDRFASTISRYFSR
ncbi:TetR/AcrR family transcriptional regulator [Erwinia aphidicola]|nr:TetR/AcrR family transcriptional regulator [Erwinia aphidicola]